MKLEKRMALTFSAFGNFTRLKFVWSLEFGIFQNLRSCRSFAAIVCAVGRCVPQRFG